MNKPLISVVIPGYRCAATIGASIDSALAQQVPLEIIVINDQSPDDLDAAMAPYLENPAVVYSVNEQNMGAAASRNRGVAMARGTYVAFLDADDLWLTGKLEKQLKAMEETGAVLSCTARELMTPEGVCTGRIIPVKERITYRELLKHNSVSCSSVLIRRDVALEFPMGHEDSHEDYIMWLKVLEAYGFACGINEPLLQYRLSNTGKSGSKLKSARMTFMVYRYMGFSLPKALVCFASYAFHGVWKYGTSRFRK